MVIVNGISPIQNGVTKSGRGFGIGLFAEPFAMHSIICPQTLSSFLSSKATSFYDQVSHLSVIPGRGLGGDLINRRLPP